VDGKARLTLDPSERHGFEYQSWFGFTLYAEGIPGAIGRGGTYSIPLLTDEPVDLRIIVDHSIAELFTSTGETLTVRFYPSSEHPWRLQAFAAPDARLEYTVDAWEMDRLIIKEASGETSTPSTAGFEGQNR